MPSASLSATTALADLTVQNRKWDFAAICNDLDDAQRQQIANDYNTARRTAVAAGVTQHSLIAYPDREGRLPGSGSSGRQRPQRQGPARIVIEVLAGDLLEQPRMDALVNPWNRNFVPRLLLRPGGVSGQLKASFDKDHWRQLAQRGTLPLGGVHITEVEDNKPALIHVAGLTRRWKATPESVMHGTSNAITAAWERGYTRIAMPLIGSGHGGLTPAQSRHFIDTAVAPFLADPGDLDAMKVVLVIPCAAITGDDPT